MSADRKYTEEQAAAVEEIVTLMGETKSSGPMDPLEIIVDAMDDVESKMNLSAGLTGEDMAEYAKAIAILADAYQKVYDCRPKKSFMED